MHALTTTGLYSWKGNLVSVFNLATIHTIIWSNIWPPTHKTLFYYFNIMAAFKYYLMNLTKWLCQRQYWSLPSFSQSYQPCPMSAGHRPCPTYPDTVALSGNAKRPVCQRQTDTLLGHHNSAFLCLGVLLCYFFLSQNINKYWQGVGGCQNERWEVKQKVAWPLFSVGSLGVQIGVNFIVAYIRLSNTFRMALN